MLFGLFENQCLSVIFIIICLHVRLNGILHTIIYF